ncbi:hypothetical protein SRHO_G00164620 [Serrasalmus rhombeus]
MFSYFEWLLKLLLQGLFSHPSNRLKGRRQRRTLRDDTVFGLTPVKLGLHSCAPSSPLPLVLHSIFTS